MIDDQERAAFQKEEPDERINKTAELYKRLHVCKKLTKNKRFQSSGNGLGPLYGNCLVMWFSDSRSEGKPNKRTKKSEVCTFLQQDAVDALVVFANIAEKVAPYVWAEHPCPEAPDRSWVRMSDKGTLLLIDETAHFMDRFGLPHMRSDGKGPGTRKNPVRPEKLRFTDSCVSNHESEMKRLNEMFSGKDGERVRADYISRLKEHGLWVEKNNKETAAMVFIDGLRPFAKDFSFFNSFDKERASLLEARAKLEESEKEVIIRKYRESTLSNGSVDNKICDRWQAEKNHCLNKITQLHMEQNVLIQACEDANRMFSDQERKLIENEGVVLPDIGSMYQISLLFHDAIELYMAINGDDSAFERILTKIHMEIFDVESTTAVRADAFPSTAESFAEKRYTIWFESSGSDPENPGSNMERNVYEAELYGSRLRLRRQRVGWEEVEEYGCGRVVHQLCEPGETPEAFRHLARKYLPVFLGGLIDEGCNLNYKGLFAEPAVIDAKRSIITVNDFSIDLVRTLWCVMDLVSKGDVQLTISRCKCCGRLMNTAKETGNAREYCDSSCRSLYRKRVVAQEKSGKEHTDAKVRREFLEYMESGQAVRIGMSSHMGLEKQLENEPAKQGLRESLLQELRSRLGHGDI